MLLELEEDVVEYVEEDTECTADEDDGDEDDVTSVKCNVPYELYLLCILIPFMKSVSCKTQLLRDSMATYYGCNMRQTTTFKVFTILYNGLYS